jgi:DNA-binding MarR family transcriptional regulator
VTPKRTDYTGAEVRLGHLIKRCEQALIAEKSRALRPVGLTVSQYVVMLTLAENPGMSGAQLARSCMITPQSVSSLLAMLESKELVTRTQSDVHSKVFVARLTKTGQALLRKADPEALEIERQLGAEFTPAELVAFRAFLDRATTTLTHEK